MGESRNALIRDFEPERREKQDGLSKTTTLVIFTAAIVSILMRALFLILKAAFGQDSGIRNGLPNSGNPIRNRGLKKKKKKKMIRIQEEEREAAEHRSTNL